MGHDAVKKERVFISTRSFAEFDQSPIRKLEKEGFSPDLNPTGRNLTGKELTGYAAGCRGIIAGTERITGDILRKLKNLRVISRCGYGTDNVDLEAAAGLGIRVLRTEEAHVQTVAELTLGLIIALLRSIPASDRKIRQKTWKPAMGNLLHGKTLGIIGLGKVARKLLLLAGPFSLRALAYDTNPDPGFMTANDIESASLDRVLRESDIITLHIPYTPANHYIMGENEIRKMKRNAILVNTARGRLIDESALAKALDEKIIAGAALDTFENEPYDGPLTSYDNVILTPHTGSYAVESRIQMENEAADNLIDELKRG